MSVNMGKLRKVSGIGGETRGASAAELVSCGWSGLGAVRAPVIGILIALPPAVVGASVAVWECTVPLRVIGVPRGKVQSFVHVFLREEVLLSFVVNTGASWSLVEPGGIEALDPRPVGTAVPAYGANAKAPRPFVTVDDWCVESIELPKSGLRKSSLSKVCDRPTPQTLPAQGLLWSDVLSRLGAITGDHDGEALILPVCRA